MTKKWNYNFWINEISCDVSPMGSIEKFSYWWEDMRPREVLQLIKEAYTKGYERGLEEVKE